ncbi:shikimate kinase [Endomicrobium proavitum]|uniref:Shikimate kinase n=1 Tax=Endomicrobium proavitum TaxID=1408281 RepID=A0A0G3WHM7_9BACT|nr:shikimate kinase [Endomicrobium proavitum]AKL97402.1 Shikimate kinase [Endomicrobium proavitum]
MNIVLTGFMGSGKSAVGAELAKKLGFEFVDTDETVEKASGVKISEIFALYGEETFRNMEFEAVAAAAEKDNAVIATGGGAVLNAQNIINLKRNGIIIYLKASPEIIYARIKNETHRPLLKLADPLSEIKKLLSARKDAYEKYDFSFDAGEGSPREIAQKIALDSGVKKMLEEKI